MSDEQPTIDGKQPYICEWRNGVVVFELGGDRHLSTDGKWIDPPLGEPTWPTREAAEQFIAKLTGNAMSEQLPEAYLLSRGWEHVMTEEDGCDTWAYRDKSGWPESVKYTNGAQHYWDRDDAVKLQQHIDKLLVMKCGHPQSLLVCSVESDYRYCELCETKDRLRDALTMESDLRQKSAALATENADLRRRLEEANDNVRASMQAAKAWAALCNGIEAIRELDEFSELTSEQQKLDSYIQAWSKMKQRAETAERQLAEARAKIDELECTLDDEEAAHADTLRIANITTSGDQKE